MYELADTGSGCASTCSSTGKMGDIEFAALQEQWKEGAT